MFTVFYCRSVAAFSSGQSHTPASDKNGLDDNLLEENVCGDENVVHPGEDWATACEAGLQLLLEQRAHEGNQNFFDGVALVSWTSSSSASTQVEFIQWTEPGIKGRIADLDEDGCLKPIVAVGQKRIPIDFRGVALNTRIVWQDTFVKPVRAAWKKNQSQGKMHSHLIKLREMWSLAANPCQRRSETHSRCFICSQIKSPQLPDHPSLRCSLCLLVSHESCLSVVASSLHSGEFSLPPTRLTDDININEIFLLPDRPGTWYRISLHQQQQLAF